MSDRLQAWGMAGARVLMALIFLQSGIAKLAAPEATRAYIEAMHLPGLLVWPTIIFELVAAALIIVGYKTRVTAVLLAVYCFVTAAIFHSHLSDQMQLINFMKNIAMAGGFLLFASVGPGPLSIDARSSPAR